MKFLSFLSDKSVFLYITIKVHPNSSRNNINITEYDFDIFITDSPEKGKANKTILKLLSKFFNIPSSELTIVKGLKSRTKIISVSEENVQKVKEIIFKSLN